MGPLCSSHPLMALVSHAPHLHPHPGSSHAQGGQHCRPHVRGGETEFQGPLSLLEATQLVQWCRRECQGFWFCDPIQAESLLASESKKKTGSALGILAKYSDCGETLVSSGHVSGACKSIWSRGGRWRLGGLSPVAPSGGVLLAGQQEETAGRVTQPAGGWSWKGLPLRTLDPETRAAPPTHPQPGQPRGGEGKFGVWSVSLTLLLSCFPCPCPRPACSCLSLGFWWWKSSSLCEANDLPLCEAYWRLDPDTDSADGLSAPVLASPEPSAGPLQAAAPVHSHASGPGPTEHA